MTTLPRTLNPAASLPLPQIEAFCKKWGIARLEIFGSAVRADFSEASDFDFLYTLKPGRELAWEIVEMEAELHLILGRDVDLLSRRGIERSGNWIRRAAILRDALPVYEA
jgi:uncharacterized protein